MLFLLYKYTDDGVFDNYPKISDLFLKISEDFPKLFWRPDDCSWTFSKNFWKFPFRRCSKISKDCRRLSRKTWRCFDDTPMNLSTIYKTDWISGKSLFSSHVGILYHLYQFVTTRYTTDFYIIKKIHDKVAYFTCKTTFK